MERAVLLLIIAHELPGTLQGHISEQASAVLHVRVIKKVKGYLDNYHWIPQSCFMPIGYCQMSRSDIIALQLKLPITYINPYIISIAYSFVILFAIPFAYAIRMKPQATIETWPAIVQLAI